MSYGGYELIDDVIDALGLTIPEEDWEDLSAQADLILEEIERLQSPKPIGGRSKGDQLIADLIEWSATMGGFESRIWRKARKYMEAVRAAEVDQ